MLAPSWMKIDVIRNVIHIKGVPEFSDLGKLFIRIANNSGYIIK